MKSSPVAAALVLVAMGGLLDVGPPLRAEQEDDSLDPDMTELAKMWIRLKADIEREKGMLNAARENKQILFPGKSKGPQYIGVSAEEYGRFISATTRGNDAALLSAWKNALKFQISAMVALQDQIVADETVLKKIEDQLAAKARARGNAVKTQEQSGARSVGKEGMEPGTTRDQSPAAPTPRTTLGPTSPGAKTQPPAAVPGAAAQDKPPRRPEDNFPNIADVLELLTPGPKPPTSLPAVLSRPGKEALYLNVVRVFRYDDIGSAVAGASVRVTAPIQGPSVQTDGRGLARLYLPRNNNQGTLRVDPPNGSDLQGEELPIDLESPFATIVYLKKVTSKTIFEPKLGTTYWLEKRSGKTYVVTLFTEGGTVLASVSLKPMAAGAEGKVSEAATSSIGDAMEYVGQIADNQLILEHSYKSIDEIRKHLIEGNGEVPDDVLEIIREKEQPVARYVLSIKTDTEMEGFLRNDWSFQWNVIAGKGSLKNFKTNPNIDVIWKQVKEP